MRLAILVPVYNGQVKLDESLRSIKCPEGFYVEVVVVDDGSTIPIEINVACEACIKLIKFSENQGIVSALNKGLEYIVAQNFDYVARLDAGDVNVNGRLEKQCDFLTQNPNIALLGSYVDFVDEGGAVVFSQQPPQTHAELSNAMYSNNCFCHPAVMFRTAALNNVGFYSDHYPRAEDYEIFWRFLNMYETATIPEVLLLSDAGSDGISRQNRKEQLMTRLKIQREHFKLNKVASWVGLVKTTVLLFLPLAFVEAIKGLK
jgi:glycosyltransferase involved in cell wall biosynthesis